MTHTYHITGMTCHITGMTCKGCEAKVKSRLLSVPGITAASVSREDGSAVVSMDTHVTLDQLQEALGQDGKYKISAPNHTESTEQDRSWLQTYHPILLIFGYITGIVIAIQLHRGT